MFNKKAPIHIYQYSEEPAPLTAVVDIETPEQRNTYWELLQGASDVSAPYTTLSPQDGAPAHAPGLEFIRTIRKPYSWISTYTLSSLQSRFLSSLIDPATGINPIDDEGVLDTACYITGAPPDTVRAYLDDRTFEAQEVLQRIRQREEKRLESKKKKSQARQILSHKAVEARERSERDWVDLITRLHPEPLTEDERVRLHHIHTSFINTGGRLGGNRDDGKLESNILKVLEPAVRRGPGPIPMDISARLRLGQKARALLAPRGRGKATDKSVYDLVNQQEHRPEARRLTKKEIKTLKAAKAAQPGTNIHM